MLIHCIIVYSNSKNRFGLKMCSKKAKKLIELSKTLALTRILNDHNLLKWIFFENSPSLCLCCALGFFCFQYSKTFSKPEQFQSNQKLTVLISKTNETAVFNIHWKYLWQIFATNRGRKVKAKMIIHHT